VVFDLSAVILAGKVPNELLMLLSAFFDLVLDVLDANLLFPHHTAVLRLKRLKLFGRNWGRVSRFLPF
jgi:hypothetical protein